MSPTVAFGLQTVSLGLRTTQRAPLVPEKSQGSPLPLSYSVTVDLKVPSHVA